MATRVMLFVALVGAFSLHCGAGHPPPSPDAVKAITKRGADWQIVTFDRHREFRALLGRKVTEWKNRKNYHDLVWNNGALYAGMYEWSTLSEDPKYTDWLKSIGERNGWVFGGLAWGINQGLLNRATFEPAVLEGWQALTECVTDEALLGYVQPVGAKPGDSYADLTEVYGVGALLPAGTEVYKLVGGHVPAAKEPNMSATTTFMKDGCWCWYQDPRAIIKSGKLIVGGLSGQSGDVKVSVYDLETDKDLGTVVLHEAFERDDHDVPALFAESEGQRYLHESLRDER